MKILVSESAFRDLENIIEYYKKQKVPKIGTEMVDAVIEHVQVLIKHPDIGRKVPEFDESYIREIIHPPFRIVYLRESSIIQVIRVWRSERILKLPENET